MHPVAVAFDSPREVAFEGRGAAREEPARDSRVSAVLGRMTTKLGRKTANKTVNPGQFSQYITAM
jgi:hypothetical protein